MIQTLAIVTYRYYNYSKFTNNSRVEMIKVKKLSPETIEAISLLTGYVKYGYDDKGSPTFVEAYQLTGMRNQRVSTVQWEQREGERKSKDVLENALSTINHLDILINSALQNGTVSLPLNVIINSKQDFISNLLKLLPTGKAAKLFNSIVWVGWGEDKKEYLIGLPFGETEEEESYEWAEFERSCGEGLCIEAESWFGKQEVIDLPVWA
jgi:hypothetical protein